MYPFFFFLLDSVSARTYVIFSDFLRLLPFLLTVVTLKQYHCLVSPLLLCPVFSPFFV